MKNTLTFVILGALAFYFWPSHDEAIDENEEYIEQEVVEEKPQQALVPQPKKEEVKQLPSPTPRPPQVIANTKKVEMPLVATNSQGSADHYKSKTPPKQIEFKIKKNGDAIAFGDIYLGKVNNPNNLSSARTTPKPVSLWDSVDIPFHIDASVSQKSEVEDTIAFFNQNTNLNFVKNDGSYQDSIVFIKGDEHCYSYLGKIGGHQPIFLSSKCRGREIAHEIMHALGFVHEHTRPNRNQYVKINWENIKKGFERQFSLVPNEFVETTLAGFPFSYNSIMLYDANSFAKSSGKTTIQSITGKKIAPSKDILSADDINRINNTY